MKGCRGGLRDESEAEVDDPREETGQPGGKEPRKKDLGWEGHGRARYMACLFGEARRSQNTCIWVPNGVGTKIGVKHDAVCR